ncbi:hypothetical protein [uncultured Mobiluncus sp.]|uniref:hypothetical protein n=1 Tax=uncultured Mobiluncus sp. TaxID=293425 RepID=UPI002624C4E4|nr:hypothetical protein [uncultured Mobiluncus sp.]
MSKKPKPDVTLVSRIFAPEPAAASFRLEALVKALIEGGKKVNVLTTHPRPCFGRERLDFRDLRAGQLH